MCFLASEIILLFAFHYAFFLVPCGKLSSLYSIIPLFENKVELRGVEAISHFLTAYIMAYRPS